WSPWSSSAVCWDPAASAASPPRVSSAASSEWGSSRRSRSSPSASRSIALRRAPDVRGWKATTGDAQRRTHRSREKEGRMSNRLAGRVLAGALGLTVLFVVWVVGSASAGGTAACGTVTLNEQAWAGSTANTYVAKYVLEKKLGCKVKITQITEIPVYQAMASGKGDAVLEDWQHDDQYKQCVTTKKTGE